MWIPKKLLRIKEQPDAVTGMVKGSANVRLSTASVDGSGACSMVSVPGIVSIPTDGDQVVVLQTADGAVCLGVRLPYYDGTVEPGEIFLSSSGGASIKLANDGKVYINGQEVTNGS